MAPACDKRVRWAWTGAAARSLLHPTAAGESPCDGWSSVAEQHSGQAGAFLARGRGGAGQRSRRLSGTGGASPFSGGPAGAEQRDFIPVASCTPHTVRHSQVWKGLQLTTSLWTYFPSLINTMAFNKESFHKHVFCFARWAQRSAGTTRSRCTGACFHVFVFLVRCRILHFLVALQ